MAPGTARKAGGGRIGDRPPRVTVVIPHAGGRDLLVHCLKSLGRTAYQDFSILVVDNGSQDGTQEMLRKRFPDVRTVRSESNLGFAGGCNLGIRRTDSAYVVLLNNDTEVTPDWLGPMVLAADSDPDIAAVQPKLLSYFERDRFDYSGGCGGELDIFGYPFVWGRLFDTVERDKGQYDGVVDIFWATGAATLLRRQALDRVGLLDETFFAHMEEIDLNWRFHCAGYRVVSVPSAVVYHRAGGTLGKGEFKKTVLNHRNSILMVLKNHSFPVLCWILPLRLMLEGLTVLSFIFLGRWKSAAAVVRGLAGVLPRWKTVDLGRREMARIRRTEEPVLMHRFYRGSAALRYFLGGVRTTEDLWRKVKSSRD